MDMRLCFFFFFFCGEMWSKVMFLCILGCSSCLTTSFDLGGVMSGNRMAGVPLGRSLGAGELDVEGVCTRQGITCQDCTRTVTCVPLPIGFLKVPLQECMEGQTCNAHEGGCSPTPVPECDIVSHKFEHTCEQVGIFPDAYDCRKFHLCSPPEGLPDGRPADHRVALCPRHYGYNPRTAQCSVKLSNGQCIQKLVPNCQQEGFTDVLPSSPNHYYVCLRKGDQIYPQIFICPHGWYFWDGFCRPEPKSVLNGPFDEVVTVVTRTTEKNEANSKNETKEGNSSEEKTNDNGKVERSTTKIDSFFSTEKAVTYPADTFLADKFDLTNYESTDDIAPPADEYNSFESNDFW